MKRTRHATDRVNKSGNWWQSEYKVKCIVCGTQFDAKRDDASFCSATCRSRHHRAEQRRQQRIAATEAAVRHLIDATPPGNKSDEFMALVRMRAALDRAISEHQSGQLELPAWKEIKKPTSP